MSLCTCTGPALESMLVMRCHPKTKFKGALLWLHIRWTYLVRVTVSTVLACLLYSWGMGELYLMYWCGFSCFQTVSNPIPALYYLPPKLRSHPTSQLLHSWLHGEAWQVANDLWAITDSNGETWQVANDLLGQPLSCLCCQSFVPLFINHSDSLLIAWCLVQNIGNLELLCSLTF